MDAEEFARQAKSLAEEMSAASSRWEARAKKLQRDLERAERKLEQIRLEHKRRLDALWASYSSGGASPAPAPEQVQSTGTRKRRGSLDAPLLQLIREQFHDDDFTIHDVIALWNSHHPLDNVSASTIRGVLNRHVNDGRLRQVEKGRQGHGNLDRFALDSDAEDSASMGGVAVELAH